MRVCVIFPRTTVFEQPLVYGPLGLWYIMAVLKNIGIQSDYLDMSQKVDGRTIEYADIPLDFDAYLIGGTSPQAQEIIGLGKFLRKHGKTIMVGGPHVTNNAGRPFSSSDLQNISFRELMRLEDNVLTPAARIDRKQLKETFHVLVKSEGERSILEAFERLDESRQAMDEFGEGIVIEQSLIPREEMDQIPIPDRTFAHLYNALLFDDAGNSYPTTTTFTSRGCPERCAFCDSPALWGRGVRYIPMHKVQDEFGDIYRRGYRGVYFYDDILPLNKSRTLEMYGLLHQYGFVSRCNLRTDIISKDSYGFDFLKALCDRGLVDVFVGVESGSNQIKSNIHKGTTIEQDSLVLDWCKQLGIKFKASVILGLPGETVETMEATRRWVLEHRPHKINVCLFIPFAGIPIVKGKAAAQANLDNRADQYGDDAIHDYDIGWDLDPTELQKYFYAGSRKAGGLRALTHTSALSEQQIQDFFDRFVEEIDREGIPF